MTEPLMTADALATTVRTYRITSRKIRSKMRRGNPIARGFAALIQIRDRAMTILDAAAPPVLTDAIRDEDALLIRLGFLRESGLNDTGCRAALESARVRRHEIMTHLQRGTLAPDLAAPRSR